jgi:predicted metal-dependent HD superfamily phosphohydrolase
MAAMVILIDPPVWPAHGTVWSHLASDASYDELHVFAQRAGIPRRGFDLDHYDVPQYRYDDLVAAGATPVAARILLGRLQAAGLRVRQIDKHREGRRRSKADLRRHWSELARDAGVRADPAWHALGEELLLRWSEPHRSYHDLVHLHDVLLALESLADLGEKVTVDVVLAAWFHDAVYDGFRLGGPTDEERSAELAATELAKLGVAEALCAEVARLVRATTPGVRHDGDYPAMVLTDADTAILAAVPKRYAAYVAGVRAEYAQVPEDAFRQGRAAIMETYLQASRLYETNAAYQRWEERARINVSREIADLRRESPAAPASSGSG